MSEINEYRTHHHCPLCESERISPKLGYENNFLGKCANCKFIFCLRKPTDQELIDYYSDYGSVEIISDITVKRYNELLDKFEPFRKTNKIIDVGCGRGHFLKVAKERGWEVYGTEYSDQLVNHGNTLGVKMLKGDIEELNFGDIEFDVVTSFEVLEHTHRVRGQVMAYSRILRPGGALYLTTPDFNSIIRFRVGADYSIINYPEHLTYFTQKTLHKLLRKSGFSKVYLYSHGISFNRLRRSKLKSEPLSNGNANPDENLREKIEKSKVKQLAKKAVNFTLSTFGLGHSLKALYVKST
jgi:2-polyprenyl-3-methyl-5-hydroxy-6-metoxy-1,4-benzoquinol methylase